MSGLSDLVELEVAVASSLACPNAAGCVWQSYMESGQRERAIRADEAMQWQRTVDRLVARVERLERDLRAARKGSTK